jgi:O-antigen/teichoic acid export membrane protein
MIIDLRWLKVSEALAADARTALLLASLSIPATTLTSGLKGVLEGLEQFQRVNVLRLILGLANFGAPVIAVALAGPSLTIVVLGLVVARWVIWVLHHLAVRQALPRPATAGVSLRAARLRELLIFGSWMTLSNLISPLMVVADRFVISALLGAAAVAYYAVPSDMLIKLLILPAALSTAAFPAFARLIATDLEAAAALYRRSLLSILAVMAPLMGLIAVCAHPGLSLWLGAAFADNAATVVAILCLGIVLNSLAQIPLAMTQGAGRVKETSLLHLTEFACYAPALFFATTHFGLKGAALAWTGRAGADAILLHLLAREALNVRTPLSATV